MSEPPRRPRNRVLIAGFGAFGPVHLLAWYRLGLGDRVWVADPDPAARDAAVRHNVPPERVVPDGAAVLDRVDVVDVVAPSDRHFDLCRAALDAGRDVFVEKPLVPTLDEARVLAELVGRTGRVLQVGFPFRFHPAARAMREALRGPGAGPVRYLAAEFSGFKRPRKDSGVLENDLVHFLDLAGWLLGEAPAEVYAVTRDLLGRGREDLAVVLLTYPGGVVARLEATCHLPGDRADTVVPNALSRKRMAVAADGVQLDAEFQEPRLTVHRGRHECANGGWRTAFEPSAVPVLPPASPVDVMVAQLGHFLDRVRDRARPDGDVWDAGVRVAALLHAIRASAQRNAPVRLDRLDAGGTS